MLNKRWVKGIIGMAILLTILLITGSIYQANATAQDMILYPASGELVTVEGSDMHLYCIGEGSPTVLFEAGLGGNYMDWVLIQPSIGEQTRACAYDRSGMGYSDYIGTALDSEATAERLHQALSAAQIEPPYILVGHSIGGIHVRSFYELYPEDVVGMVLVDSSHEHQAQYLPQAPFFVDMLYTIAPSLTRVGIVRGLNLAQQNVATHLTPDHAAQSLAIVNQTTFWQALGAENQMATVDTNQEQALSSLGDLPLLVISQDVNAMEELDPDIASLFRELQGELTALSTNGTHIFADGAGHYVHYDRPQLVIDSILNMLHSLSEL